MHAAGAPPYPDAVVQALFPLKQLQVYARYDTHTSAPVLQTVEQLDITAAQFANLPNLSEAPRLNFLDHTVVDMLPRALAASPPLFTATHVRPTQV